MITGAGAGDEAENEEGGEGGDAAKKRKVNRQEATLAKNAAQLQTKKLDLEFTIDPLFKKTSGDFDEGGAQGLLMNHLAVDSGLRVIFDAMDTPGGAEEVEDEEVISLQVSLADLRGMTLVTLRARLTLFGQPSWSIPLFFIERCFRIGSPTSSSLQMLLLSKR